MWNDKALTQNLLFILSLEQSSSREKQLSSSVTLKKLIYKNQHTNSLFQRPVKKILACNYNLTPTLKTRSTPSSLLPD